MYVLPLLPFSLPALCICLCVCLCLPHSPPPSLSHNFRECPYVIPIHVSFYGVHMLQEHFGIYNKANHCHYSPVKGSRK